MNQFQILDRQGKPVTIGDLDKEACSLWGTELNKKLFASPYDIPSVIEEYKKEAGPNKPYLAKVRMAMERQDWFNKLGWNITQGETSWLKLKHQVLEVYIENGLLNEAMDDVRIKGFVDLIDLWESQGYIAVSLDCDNNILAKGGIRTATEAETTVIL